MVSVPPFCSEKPSWRGWEARIRSARPPFKYHIYTNILRRSLRVIHEVRGQRPRSRTGSVTEDEESGLDQPKPSSTLARAQRRRHSSRLIWREDLPDTSQIIPIPPRDWLSRNNALPLWHADGRHLFTSTKSGRRWRLLDYCFLAQILSCVGHLNIYEGPTTLVQWVLKNLLDDCGSNK